ncbi:hypothetical protein QQF64_020414 [Cirrhinus molitorella]|uniref:Uncharacterized protein n=1 Tax=Cirrhinus molitorella TaxID=172907 RepID=A0ABR3L932_9TELE
MFTLGSFGQVLKAVHQSIDIGQPQHLYHQHPRHLMSKYVIFECNKTQTDQIRTDKSSNFCSTYTHIYAPITIDSNSSDLEDVEKLPEEDSQGHDGLTAADIMSNLAHNLDKTSCSRFNINRANVWDGALRGFRRSSVDPICSLMVKFTDDAGLTEESLDSRAPTREFLTLLLDNFKTRRVFEGKDNAKYLSFDSKGRFKEGLETLDFANALEQHPSLFFSFMCYTETKLTADAVEYIFHVQFSQPGSTNRQEEARVLNYWRDYLLYLEAKEACPSLEDVLMFGTRLSSRQKFLLQQYSHIHSFSDELTISHGKCMYKYNQNSNLTKL